MKNSPPQFLVTFSDLWRICKQSKGYIFGGVVLFGLLGMLYTLSRPLEYISQGSFREKGKSSSGITSNNVLSYLTMSGNTGNSEAAATLKSRTLLLELIYKLNLQGVIKKRSQDFRLIKNIKDNLVFEYSHYKNVISPYFEETPAILFLSDVDYQAESPLNFRLRFLNATDFQIEGAEKALQGKIGEPYTYKNSTFVINRDNEQQGPLINEEYEISFMPVEIIFKSIADRISIEPDKEDKNLLRIKYRDSNRFHAAKIINALMAIYQNYLWKEQQFITNTQVDYLSSRHAEVTEHLKGMMNEHAKNLSLDVAVTGYPDTATAMSFLAQTQQQYARELLAIELEVKRLLQIESEGTLQYLATEGSTGLSSFNQLLNKIHELKKQADTLDIALREVDFKNPSPDLLTPDLNSQLAALNDQKELYADTVHLLISLEKGKPPKTASKLMQDPKYKVKVWYDHLIHCKPNSLEWSHCLHYFTAYVSNLQRLFQVHSIAIEEQLTHQQGTLNEYQGIDLNTAGALYVSYNNDLNTVEAFLKQMKFIIDQMGEPEFEISSLSNFLEDPVSKDMISTASNLALSLRDRENRSVKELERVQHDLDIQKGFLLVHLNQTAQLHQLKKELLERKINSLQHATLSLVREEISVLDQHLRDHISARIKALLQEQTILETHQQQVKKEMALLPQKWVGEKMIEQQMDINKKMVEEVTKLVESKNIARNLELIQSAPLDAAYAPVYPQPPRTMLFLILGTLFGGLLTSTFIIAHRANKGIPLTAENLRGMGYPVLGALSKRYIANDLAKIRDYDLEIFRRIINFLNKQNSYQAGPKSALLVLNGQIDHSPDLALLMQKSGHIVVLLPLSQVSENETESKQTDESNGLFQYLQGSASFPKIVSESGVDRIITGGSSRFSQELIASPRFNDFLNTLLKSYDWVFIVTTAAPSSPEVQALARIAFTSVVTINGETANDLTEISNIQNVSFLL